MRILLTNDDGITAPGIRALWQALCGIADVYVAAPSEEQSAKSQAITVREPIRVDPFCSDAPITAWKIGGTPADCVKLALETLLPEKPDMLISGINRGPNLGTDVFYSGTVGAALEGAFKGVFSLALSVDTRADTDFAEAAAFAADFVRHFDVYDKKCGQVLNVNFPRSWRRGDKIAVTTLGRRDYINGCEARQDPTGRTYYWMGGQVIDLIKTDGTDLAEASRGVATITPLRLDLSDHAAAGQLKDWWGRHYGN